METVLKSTILAMQVCVPETHTEEQIIAFAEKENPCGTSHGWGIAKEGHASLMGHSARVKCSELSGHIHCVLIA